jgi:hypothetical protein
MTGYLSLVLPQNKQISFARQNVFAKVINTTCNEMTGDAEITKRTPFYVNQKLQNTP